MQEHYAKILATALKPELAWFERSLLAFIQPLGKTAAELKLNESYENLCGLLVAILEPNAFQPVLPDTSLDGALCQAFNAFYGLGYVEQHANVSALAWISHLATIAPTKQELETNIEGTHRFTRFPLVEHLKERVRQRTLIPIKNIETVIATDLLLSITACVQTALRLRLHGVPLFPDFFDITCDTATKIIFYSVVARATQHSALEEIVRFEMLLGMGVLPVGRSPEVEGVTKMYGLRLYKTDEQHNIRKDTVMFSATPKSRISSKPPQPTGMGIANARQAFMDRLREIAGQWMPVGFDFTGPFRFWCAFMKYHVDSGVFAFNNVATAEIATVVMMTTGHEINDVLPYHPGNLQEVQQGKADAAMATIVNPYGTSLWINPYGDEDKILIGETPADRNSKDRGRNLKNALFEHLLPGLDMSLRGAGVTSSTNRKLLAQMIAASFYVYFEAVLRNDRDRARGLERLLDLFIRGVIPFGMKSYGPNMVCVTVMKGS